MRVPKHLCFVRGCKISSSKAVNLTGEDEAVDALNHAAITFEFHIFSSSVVAMGSRASRKATGQGKRPIDAVVSQPIYPPLGSRRARSAKHDALLSAEDVGGGQGEQHGLNDVLFQKNEVPSEVSTCRNDIKTVNLGCGEAHNVTEERREGLLSTGNNSYVRVSKGLCAEFTYCFSSAQVRSRSLTAVRPALF